MGSQSAQTAGEGVRALARRQHWVVTRSQLLDGGLHRLAIEHRVQIGRLHPVHAGVFAVGRPELSRLGELMAAVLASGRGAVLSHGAAAELWGVRPPGRLEVTVPPERSPRRPGILIHRAALHTEHRTLRLAVPVTAEAPMRRTARTLEAGTAGDA